MLACAVSAQIPAGWNYNPYDYYPFTALQPVKSILQLIYNF